MRLIKDVICPCCRSVKAVKNGKKETGVQNILCRDCGLQFQDEYIYHGAAHKNKDLLKRMLLRGSGVRDCSIYIGHKHKYCTEKYFKNGQRFWGQAKTQFVPLSADR